MIFLKSLYSLSVVTATNHHVLSGLKQHGCILFQLGRSEVQNGSYSDKTKASLRLPCFRGLKGRICRLAFSSFQGCPVSPNAWSLTPSSDRPLLGLPASSSHFVRILVATRSPTRSSLHLNIINYTCQGLFAMEGSKFTDPLGCGNLWGHFSTYYNPRPRECLHGIYLLYIPRRQDFNFPDSLSWMLLNFKKN